MRCTVTVISRNDDEYELNELPEGVYASLAYTASEQTSVNWECGEVVKRRLFMGVSFIDKRH